MREREGRRLEHLLIPKFQSADLKVRQGTKTKVLMMQQTQSFMTAMGDVKC